MKTPVLIAACNEEAYIGQALAHLNAGTTEPLVVVNGSEDATAAEARHFTDNVFELPDKGKLPAIQYGLKQLGSRALEPLLMLDADSYPIMPTRWAQGMTKSVAGKAPALTAGPIAFTDGTAIGSMIRSGRRMQQALAARSTGTLKATFGANLALNTATPEMLDMILGLEHIWPGEDRYMASLVRDQGRFTQSVALGNTVLTSGRWLPSLRRRLQIGQAAAGDLVKGNYTNRRAPGVTHYFRDGQLHAYEREVMAALATEA